MPTPLRGILSQSESLELHRQQQALEERLWDSFESVALDPAHHDVFSRRFAGVLRDAGSLFASTLDTALPKDGGTGNTTIDDYRRFLVAKVEYVDRRSVDIRGCSPASLLLPYEGMNGHSSPAWWKPFTAVKHKGVSEPAAGKLKHALHAVAATRLLDNCFHRNTQGAFVNVGIAYPLDSIDLTNRRFFKA